MRWWVICALLGGGELAQAKKGARGSKRPGAWQQEMRDFTLVRPSEVAAAHRAGCNQDPATASAREARLARSRQLQRAQRPLRSVAGGVLAPPVAPSPVECDLRPVAPESRSYECDTCSICLGPLEHMRCFLACGHLFHRDCIVRALKEVRRCCPLCRQGSVLP